MISPLNLSLKNITCKFAALYAIIFILTTLALSSRMSESGSSSSFSSISSRKSLNGSTKPFGLSKCSLPKTSYRLQQRFSSRLNNIDVAPVPGEKDFIFYKFELVIREFKSNIIWFSGDSTLRNSFSYLCGKFQKISFINIPSRRLKKGVPWKDLYCDASVLNELNSELSYRPIISYQNHGEWYEDILDDVLKSFNEKYGSEEKISVQLFTQLLSLHIKAPCYTGSSEHIYECFDEAFFSPSIKLKLFEISEVSQSDLSCLIASNFISQFQIYYRQKINSHPELKQIFINLYLLSNIPRMAVPDNPFPEQNDFQFHLAEAMYSLSYKTPMCKKFQDLVLDEFVDSVRIRFIDETTWALDGTHWNSRKSYTLKKIPLKEFQDPLPQRHSCLPGDIHFRTDEGQFLKFQTYLNALF
eukprot:snap_masked-scaffold_1-processed-gene-20.31-mRNA-1 protein AED:1.00 eAED:1.00 QI:0/-1/0/0/-1/1/1/0/413